MLKKDKKIYLKSLEKNVLEENVSKVRDIVNEFHLADIAAETGKWNIDLILSLLRQLSSSKFSEILPLFNHNKQNEIVFNLKNEEIEEIFKVVDIDEAVDIITHLDIMTRKRVLESLDKETKKILSKKMTYEINTVGYHMHHEYVIVKNTSTTQEAINFIKKQVRDDKQEIAGDVFVVDRNDKLVGYISIEDLISQSKTPKVSKLIKPINFLEVDSSIESAIKIIKKYDVPSVPVVDKQKKLVGVIESKDIIDHLQSDIDLITSAAGGTSSKITQSGADKPYLEKTTKEMYRERIYWLLFLMFFGIVTQVAITGFQILWGSLNLDGNPIDEIAGAFVWSTVISFAFSTALSISSSINDAAGNSGAQTSSTLLRAIALGQIGKKDYKTVYKKEISLSLRLATTLAISSIVRTYLVWTIYTIPFRLSSPNQHWFLFLVACVGGFAFFAGVVVGNIFGTFLPIWAHKKGKDAALISSPVQTTIADAFAIIFYLGLTSAIFIPLGLAIKAANPEPEALSLLTYHFLS